MMAGQAPLGGPREIALACFLVARMVADVVEGVPLHDEQRAARVQGARHWLGSAAIPAPVRGALIRLAEAAGSGDRHALKSALDSVIAVTANEFDSGPRLELGRLAQTLAK